MKEMSIREFRQYVKQQSKLGAFFTKMEEELDTDRTMADKIAAQERELTTIAADVAHSKRKAEEASEAAVDIVEQAHKQAAAIVDDAHGIRGEAMTERDHANALVRTAKEQVVTIVDDAKADAAKFEALIGEIRGKLG